jgi:hypothetical protein
MKRILMVMLVIGALVWGKGAGAFVTHDLPVCSEFLDAYGKTTLMEGGKYSGPHEVWGVFGWVNGYLTAWDRSVGDGDALDGMLSNDVHRWVASWCRDNLSKDIDDALQALILTRQ